MEFYKKKARHGDHESNTKINNLAPSDHIIKKKYSFFAIMKQEFVSFLLQHTRKYFPINSKAKCLQNVSLIVQNNRRVVFDILNCIAFSSESILKLSNSLV